MNSEKQNLIQSLVDEEQAARRQITLQEGGRLLRRRRWRRMAGRSFAGMAILALIVLSAQQVMGPRPQAITPIASREQSGGLTDAQLLAMFPKTPIGLITLENGKKRLIFPRHSDAERYLARY